jgi:hypothetical protein
MHRQAAGLGEGLGRDGDRLLDVIGPRDADLGHHAVVIGTADLEALGPGSPLPVHQERTYGHRALTSLRFLWPLPLAA